MSGAVADEFRSMLRHGRGSDQSALLLNCVMSEMMHALTRCSPPCIIQDKWRNLNMDASGSRGDKRGSRTKYRAKQKQRAAAAAAAAAPAATATAPSAGPPERVVVCALFSLLLLISHSRLLLQARLAWVRCSGSI